MMISNISMVRDSVSVSRMLRILDSSSGGSVLPIQGRVSLSHLKSDYNLTGENRTEISLNAAIVLNSILSRLSKAQKNQLNVLYEKLITGNVKQSEFIKEIRNMALESQKNVYKQPISQTIGMLVNSKA